MLLLLLLLTILLTNLIIYWSLVFLSYCLLLNEILAYGCNKLLNWRCRITLNRLYVYDLDITEIWAGCGRHHLNLREREQNTNALIFSVIERSDAEALDGVCWVCVWHVFSVCVCRFMRRCCSDTLRWKINFCCKLRNTHFY